MFWINILYGVAELKLIDLEPYNHLVLFQEKLKNDSKTVNMHRIESEIGYVL